MLFADKCGFYYLNAKDYNDWITKYNEAKEYMLSRKSNKILIECAVQHPLINGKYPGEEFKKRLDLAIFLFNENKNKGKYVKIYVPGSRYMMNGVVDKVSLSFAGKMYLIEKGIPARDIYSVSKNIKVYSASIIQQTNVMSLPKFLKLNNLIH